MSQPFRVPGGGRIDRSRSLAFQFDGHRHIGHPGDTLASALLANGVRTVGRGVETGRPRGVVGCGPDEPNALVDIRSGPGRSPARATEVELYDGLIAWARFNRAEPGTSGPGTSGPGAGPGVDAGSEVQLSCDALVVGGGPAGLAAAYAAGTAGAEVILVDEQPELGGDLLGSRVLLDGAPAADWVAEMTERLGRMARVHLFTRMTALGRGADDAVTAVQVPTHGGPSGQRRWRFHTGQIVLATGARERPIVFTDNDRPGIMRAGAARTYANRYGVRPGGRGVVFTTNDSGYAVAADLRHAGTEIAAVVDVRPWPGGVWPHRLCDQGVRVLRGHVVFGTEGGGRDELAGVLVAHRRGDEVELVECDLLAVSGGWPPFASGSCPDPGSDSFLLQGSDRGVRRAGSVRGGVRPAEVIADGSAAGRQAAAACGYAPVNDHRVPDDASPAEDPPAQLTRVPAREPDAERRQFVDLGRDLTVEDVRRAAHRDHRPGPDR